VTRPIHLSDRDLRLVEEACRDLASRMRDGTGGGGPLIRAHSLYLAVRLEWIANRLSRSHEA
jgi:hypothetical protein